MKRTSFHAVIGCVLSAFVLMGTLQSQSQAQKPEEGLHVPCPEQVLAASQNLQLG